VFESVSVSVSSSTLKDMLDVTVSSEEEDELEDSDVRDVLRDTR
jgi:hypothetical protein